MFDKLSQRLQKTVKNLRGRGRLTEANMRETLRDVRMALLEADVAMAVVKDCLDRVRSRSTGQEVLASLTPGQALIKIVHDELIAMMGDPEPLDLATRPPAVLLLTGLQGSGKTTTAAKLARWLREEHRKTVLVASTDVYRPAAIEQLRVLADSVEAGFFPSASTQNPVDIARRAVAHGVKAQSDVVILDTAGRLHIDGAMMSELIEIHAAVQPVETLFVIDSTTGQDAVNSAKAFNDALPLTGVILTKTDGDARGGAALSVRQVTGKPIKFLGVGEGTGALEAFDSRRVTERILGMGDMLGLVQAAHRTAREQPAGKFAKNVLKGKGFDLEEFREQLFQMQKMGGVSGLLEKLPGMQNVPGAAKGQFDDNHLKRAIAIINSMTPRERVDPDIVRGSHKRRIAAGSGTQVQDVNRLLKQFVQMQRMMKQFGKAGADRMLQGLKGRFPGL
jgi:signal recognition particle subunit SRP54